MDTPLPPKLGDALGYLAAQAETLPGRYLITGAQAAYLYHRWLLPIARVVNFRVPEGDVARWQAALTAPWVVFIQTPSLTDIRPATRVAILEPHLSDALYRRRVIRNGLSFISPEDMCVQLLATAATQIALAELAALLIAQRDTLDWAYLLKETGSSQPGQRLAEIMWAINHEAGRPLLRQELIGPKIAPLSSTLLRPDTLADILRPLRARWTLADAQPAGD